MISDLAFASVLEATGYLENGVPAAGVSTAVRAAPGARGRRFRPDASWRGASSLRVYFKYTDVAPPDAQIATWRREVWNEGYAPLLWIISPSRVDIYNGFGRPVADGDAAKYLLRTFEIIEIGLSELDAYAGRLAMETGQFWSHADGVDKRTTVDRQLLGDLAFLEHDLLEAGLRAPAAQRLIERVIFTQYLLDRYIISNKLLYEHSGTSTFAEALRSKRSTQRLFSWLASTFDGDIFRGGLGQDIAEAHLARAADFLDAINPATGQMALFPYQFNIIPVELVSSIYEQFAHSDTGQEGHSLDTSSLNAETGVHYTRLPVVSLVLDEVMQGFSGAESVLDLTCGSGVFLVEAFRRLVAAGGKKAPARDDIRAVLYEQLAGVDISPAAIRVAAFSLYLAALEMDPDPQPPEALRFEPLIGSTLLVGDARRVGEEKPGPLSTNGERRQFDAIVGNPPWTFEGSAGTAERRRLTPARRVRAPRGQGLDFVVRAAEFSHATTRFGVVLSAMPFFAGSSTGRAAALDVVETLSPVTIVNLSAMSPWLFPTATMPAVILFARCRPGDASHLTVVNVPWSPAAERSSTFTIAPHDIQRVRISDWQQEPTRLKTAAFGEGRDVALLERVRASSTKLDDWLASSSSALRDGLILGSPSARSESSSALIGLPVLGAAAHARFVMPSDLDRFEETLAQWPRNREIYRAPILLVREVLRGGPRAISLVSEEDVVYTDAYFGASLPLERLDEAMVASGIMSSAFAAWFFLLTAAEYGIWKPRLMASDVRALPLPDLAEGAQSSAGRELIRLQKRIGVNPLDERAWESLDERVSDLYGFDDAERIVVRDGLQRAGWLWRKGRLASAEPATVEADILPYTKTFLAAMDAWLALGRSRSMHAEVFDLPSRVPIRIVRFVVKDEGGRSTISVHAPAEPLLAVLGRIGARLGLSLGSHLVGERELRFHGQSEVVIIKPSARRYWMRGDALADADAVVADSIAGRTH